MGLWSPGCSVYLGTSATSVRVGQWPVGVVQLAPSAGNRRLRVGGGENMPTALRSLGREQEDMGKWGGGTVGGRALGKGALISILERSGEEISDTCNIYWKSSRPWPWR